MAPSKITMRCLSSAVKFSVAVLVVRHQATRASLMRGLMPNAWQMA